jgi:putative redox protein
VSGTQNSVTVSEAGTGPYAQIVVAGRHVLSADEPESQGGHDTGPSPYDYVAAGLGCCTSITLRMYIERHKWAVRRIVVEVKHEKVPAADGAGMIDRFERTIHLDGKLSDEQQLRLLQIADKCPVSETLGQSSVVDSKLTTATPSAAA